MGTTKFKTLVPEAAHWKRWWTILQFLFSFHYSLCRFIWD